SLARKAAEISAVVRPHTTRRVSAICDSRDSDGWQQAKIRLSSSSASSLEPQSPGIPGEASWTSDGPAAASRPSFSWPVRSRPGRPPRLPRGAAPIPPAGLGGPPPPPPSPLPLPVLEPLDERVRPRLFRQADVADPGRQRRPDPGGLAPVGPFQVASVVHATS